MTPIDSWPDAGIPVLLSAHAADLLTRDAAAVLGFLEGSPERDVQVSDIAGQLLRTRRIRRFRAVIRARDRAELTAGLRALAVGEEHPLVARSDRATAPRIAFVFPGQGNQKPGMGAEAYQQLPAYRAAVDDCCAAFTSAGWAPPLRYLTVADAPETFAEIEVQGAQFTHAVGLAAAWRACGVLADLAVGHSLGEIAAAYVAGAITMADAIGVIAARAGVVARLPGRYAVAALGITAEAARAVIAETPGWLELSVINATSAVAVSGDSEAVAAAVRRVHERGQLGREITVNFPVHTSVLEPLRDWVRANLPVARFAETAVQFIGGTTGAVVTPETPFVDYWYANLRNLVRFDRAVTTAIECGATVFVEISGHPALLHAIAEQSEDATVLVGTGQRDMPLTERLAANVAAVAVADPSYRWRELPAPTARPQFRSAGFPNAPMHATHMWAQRTPLPPVQTLTVTAENWLPTRRPVAPTTGARRRVAVLPLDGASEVADALRDALATHSGVVAAEPADADLLMVIAPQIDEPDVVLAATELSRLVGQGLLAYADSITSACRDVWLVTTGAEHLEEADPPGSPAAAALAAAHRSIGFEHPDQNFHHVDLMSGYDDPTGLLDAILTGAGEIAVRARDGAPRWYRRELGVLNGSTVPAPDLPLDTGLLDNVVITGGAGAIGLHYARFLAERGARRIVLLSRRAGDAAVAAVCSELAQRYGTEVVAASCDLTDAAAVRRSAADVAGEAASLVVHTAGAAIFDSAAALDGAAFEHTMAAKVTGLALLAEHWPLRSDCRMLLCSSMSAVWGGRGHAAYSAANRMLDVMAAQLRAAGRHCVAVRWGLWQVPGESSGSPGIVDAAEVAAIERSGLLQMAPDLAVAASLRDYPVDPLILSADTDRLRIFLTGSGTGSGTEASNLAAAVEPGVDTADAVRAELAAVLSLPDPAALDLGDSLFDLGVDSLLALDLRKRLKRVVGRTVPLARLLGGITGTELVSDLDAASNKSVQRTESEVSRD